MNIRNTQPNDISKIVILEKEIEKDNAASLNTLTSRFNMFKEGFFVSQEDGRIQGYIESCLWDRKDIETFDEIKDFPKNHDPNGKTLYVIFLGVGKDYRRKGIGSRLIRTVQEYARKNDLDKVQLVAGGGFLVDFYTNLGFKNIKELPKFLPYKKGTLMEYYLK